MDWKDPEQVRAYQNEYARTHKRKPGRRNPETLRAKKKRHAAKHSERYRESAKAWRAANLEKSRETPKAWVQANKDKRRAYMRNKYATDKNYRKSLAIGGCLSRAIKNHLLDCRTRPRKPGSATFLLGCSLGELISHIESKFKSGMTWENWGNKWHIDHIRPLAKFDLLDPVQLAEACHYSNLQPLWAIENFIKSKY